MSEFLNSAGTKYLLEKIKNNYLSTADTSTITSLIGVDTTPTANSDNLITSGGVKGALDGKEDVSNQTSAITSASTHNQYPTAKAVYDAIPDVSGKANSAHTHGNITSAGTITAGAVTVANGDAIVITDASNNSAVTKSSIVFDGSGTDKVLTKRGTFETYVNSVNGKTGRVYIDIPEDMTNAEVDAIWDSVMYSLNSFTIKDPYGTYYAEDGMTWDEWIESPYNTSGIFVEEGFPWLDNVNYITQNETYPWGEISSTDLIIGDHTYGWLSI